MLNMVAWVVHAHRIGQAYYYINILFEITAVGEVASSAIALLVADFFA